MSVYGDELDDKWDAESVHDEAPIGELELRLPTLLSVQLLRDASGETDLAKAVSVDLHDRDLHELCLGPLQQCINMRILDLSFNKLSLLTGLAGCVPLRELKLYDNRLSCLGTGLAGLTLLQRLDLASNRLCTLEGPAPLSSAPPFRLAYGPPSQPPHPPCLHGLAPLRGLTCLRLAYNSLTSLAGWGRPTGLLSLDLSCNRLTQLAGLGPATALTSLLLRGNALTSLGGLSRCERLQELDAAGNRLSGLAGLRLSAASLDVSRLDGGGVAAGCVLVPRSTESTSDRRILDVSGNALSSLDSLPDRCEKLTELSASGNRLTAVSGLARLAPCVETLVVRRLAQLESCDDVERSSLGPDVQETGGGQSEFDPSLEEMEAFKRRAGVNSDLPQMGKSNTAGGDADISDERVTYTRPSTSSTSSRPPSATPPSASLNPNHPRRPPSVLNSSLRSSQQAMLRPSSAKPAVAGHRPGTATRGSSGGSPHDSSRESSSRGSSARGSSSTALPDWAAGDSAGGSRKEGDWEWRWGSWRGGERGLGAAAAVMMSARPVSARSGGATRLMDASQYENAVDPPLSSSTAHVVNAHLTASGGVGGANTDGTRGGRGSSSGGAGGGGAQGAHLDDADVRQQQGTVDGQGNNNNNSSSSSSGRRGSVSSSSSGGDGGGGGCADSSALSAGGSRRLPAVPRVPDLPPANLPGSRRRSGGSGTGPTPAVGAKNPGPSPNSRTPAAQTKNAALPSGVERVQSPASSSRGLLPGVTGESETRAGVGGVSDHGYEDAMRLFSRLYPAEPGLQAGAAPPPPPAAAAGGRVSRTGRQGGAGAAAAGGRVSLLAGGQGGAGVGEGSPGGGRGKGSPSAPPQRA
ncbi:MAG: hypothetical protein WDW38_000150 [Sanguina aurantia]